jgi:hypothetical protein
MRTRSLAIIVAALIVVALASPAWAVCHTSMGRFLQRDPNGMQIGPTISPQVAQRAVASEGGQRFIQRDLPIPGLQYSDGQHLYQYLRSSPVNHIDPNGTFSRFVDCCTCQERALSADEALAQQQITTLKASIQAAIAADIGQYPWFTGFKLNNAISILDKASAKLQNGTAKCVQTNRNEYARTTPWGNTVEIYEGNTPGNALYWGITDTAQAAALVHEGTHMGAGTTDFAYFWQNNKSPHDVLIIGWDIIASTYDTWILAGFCVPGHNCPKTVSVAVSRGGKECP